MVIELSALYPMTCIDKVSRRIWTLTRGKRLGQAVSMLIVLVIPGFALCPSQTS